MVMFRQRLGGFGQLSTVEERTADGVETCPVFLGEKVGVFVFNAGQGSPVYRRI